MLVAVHELDFCPNSFQPQRVDESSAQHFSYPFFCGRGSPFAKGDVWGIDRGWASPVGGGRRPAEGLRPGRYKVAIEIRTVYRRAFGISRPDGRAVLDVRAKKRRGGGRGLKRTTRSHKQSFCIAATDAIDLTVPEALWQPPIFDGLFGTSEGSICGRRRGSLWIRQRLGAGWGDTYMQSDAGQAFDITNVPNGTYYVEVEVNPGGRLFETTEANNVELRKIRLRGRSKARTVSVKPWCGIDA